MMLSRLRAGRGQALRFALVWLALTVQLAVGAAPPRIDPIAAVLDAQTECDAAAHLHDGAPAPPMHPLDCFTCPLCVALHLAPFMPTPLAVTPAPVAAFIRLAYVRPPATAPPPQPRSQCQPRGPPSC